MGIMPLPLTVQQTATFILQPMLDTTPAMPTGFARRLLAFEVTADNPSVDEDSGAFRVCEKLREPLGKLLGVDGFRSLLSRAQSLAGAELPWLLTLKIKAGGCWDLDGLEAALGADAIAEGEVFLVGQLLGLLVIFIGPALTMQLVYEIWPKWEISSLTEEKV